MVAKIITFTGNAVKDKDTWFCRKCIKKFKLGQKIASKNGKANNTNHYCVRCAKKLNLL